MGKWRAIAVPALAIGLVLVGCSSTAPEARRPSAPTRDVVIDGVPFLDGATAGAGSEIGDGVDVVPGSRMLAGRFPTYAPARPGGPDNDAGWTAVVVVTGDARTVLESYAAEAAKLDLPVPQVVCGSTPASDRVGGLPTWSCTALAVSSDRRHSFRLDYLRAGRTTGRGPISHLWIAVEDLSAPPDVFLGPEPPVAPDAGDPGAGSTLPWGRLPQVGQGLEAGTDNQPALAVAADTRLVGPAGVPVQETDPAPPFAVVRVDGDLRDAVAAYLRSGGVGAPGDVDHLHRREDGADIDRYHWTNGDSYLMSTYRRPGRPTWLTIQHLAGD